ncbi:hypothetical protein F53441_2479 [Fusarium austroafricanum]|uniref:Uncharacterized protein n=1 Tax=Fusarium austroafricanum TaxID=2364996 RepID=A0A8H4NXS2_9HYPO|nr:hypothetical protein F53441_2479 [Fusarium austroafricanum]
MVNYYYYEPSLPVAAIFAVVFILSFAFHLFQTIRTRIWFFVPFLVGSLFEAIAFVSRAVSARESPNYTFGPCVLQNLLLLLGPTCYAASIYMGLGRYIRKLEGEQFSLLKPKWLTKVFLVGDIVSIALQAVDGGKFVKVDTADNETTVESIVIAGLMVQLVFFTLFIALASSFHFRFLNNSTVQPYGWQKFMVVISVASALILVRSLFRMIEYVEGRDGELQSKEVYIYVLDAIPMAIVSIGFHVFHPSNIHHLNLSNGRQSFNNAGAAPGILGRYYAARHTLGHYRSVCVTASYNIDSLNEPTLNSYHERLDRALEDALQSTIRQNSALLLGISDEKKDGIPLYKQVQTIDKKDILKIVDFNDPLTKRGIGGIFDKHLAQVLGQQHAEFFSPDKPAWKVIIIKHMSNSDSPNFPKVSLLRLDIAFFAHHAVADGLSGVAFHASLLDNLKPIPEGGQLPHWPMQFQSIQDLPVGIEDCIDCLSCSCDLCDGPSSVEEPVWAGAPISTTPIANFESRIRIVTVPAKDLSVVLQQCRQAKATLTGLLHSLICTALIRGIDDNESGFRSVTPFSVRKHTGASEKDIVNHVCFLTSYVSHEQLNRITSCDSHSTAEQQHIMDLARSFSDEIWSKVKQYPHDNMVKRVSRIKDTMSHCQNQEGTKRLYTYELSNMGSIAYVSPPDNNALDLERLAFTQCGLVTGPAMAFNCVSVAGGCLTINITWERGIVEDSLIEFVAEELEKRLVKRL